MNLIPALTHKTFSKGKSIEIDKSFLTDSFRFFGGQGGHGGHGGFHFDFFGGQGGGRPRTSDVKVQFKVALQDVYKGAELKVLLQMSMFII